MSTTFTHPDLGEVDAKSVDGAVQFLGLKYASLRDRFAPPLLQTSYDAAGRIDASKYGPPPVSLVGVINNEFGFLQKSLPLPDVPTHSDTECLNLNITVPLGPDGTVQTNAELPVYVFIHGGGFAFGSSWYPHYDAAAIVRLSVEMGKPIIGVTINYRLGAPGFLTSRELRDAGYKANNGYHDQRTALKWLRKYIGGFGGDPDEITAVGESAGGLSVMMLLTSQEPLMKRCLCTGAALLLFKPLPEAVAESMYQKVVDACGFTDLSPEERIKALLELPADELLQKVPPGTQLSPINDGETSHPDPSFTSFLSQDESATALMPGREWCSDLMLGDSKLDANVFAWLGLDAQLPNLSTKFIASATKTLISYPSALTSLLSTYSLTPSTPDDEAMLSILRFATEIGFYACTRAVATGWPKSASNRVFLYHFNEGNPWEGRFRGEAGHILDVAFLFQNYNHEMGEGPRAVARKFGEDFVAFVHGEQPWPAVQEGGKEFGARAYGAGGGVYVADGKAEEVGRNERVLRLGEEIGFDLVMDVFLNFLQGK